MGQACWAMAVLEHRSEPNAKQKEAPDASIREVAEGDTVHRAIPLKSVTHLKCFRRLVEAECI
jgi:hypothetical protein